MLQDWVPIIPELTFTSVVDILAVAALLYNFILMLRGRRAISVLTGLLVLVIVYLIAVSLKLDLLRTVLSTLAPYTAIALIVMFHAEIRAMLARLGRLRWSGMGGRLERREVVEEVMLAVEQMIGQRAVAPAGALIVIERDIGLRTFIESGVALDALVSRDLLCSIFQAGGQLHDGAAIIQGDRIAAAACFLPLHVPPVGNRKLGTRHRAAIGITEESDALAIAISEETGQISVAWRGELESNVSLERLRERLIRHVTGARGNEERAPEPQLGRAQP
jgi:diadenylate cyclase